MPKSRGRKKKAKNGKISSPLLKIEKFNILRSIVNHPLVTLFCIIAAWFTWDEYLSREFSDPEIHVSSAQLEHPFFINFSLHNPSTWFAMDYMQITCVILYAQDDRGSSFRENRVAVNANNILLPSKTGQYVCPFDRAFHGFGNITIATVILDMNFNTFNIRRHFQSEPFNWNPNTHQWNEGAIMH